MTPKVAEFLNLGMRRDVADSKVGNQYVYENNNARIDTNDGDTVYSVTNERGNLYKGIEIPGQILGVCELLDGVVVFSKMVEIEPENENYEIHIEPGMGDDVEEEDDIDNGEDGTEETETEPEVEEEITEE